MKNLSAYAFSTYGNDAALYNGIRELETALIQAVDLIKGWHNMPFRGAEDADRAWELYFKNAPEMKIVREAVLGCTPEEAPKHGKQA